LFPQTWGVRARLGHGRVFRMHLEKLAFAQPQKPFSALRIGALAEHSNLLWTVLEAQP
jgi:hypothetical protein